MRLKSITRLWYNLIPKLKWRRGGEGCGIVVVRLNFQHLPKFLFVFPTFCQAQKVAKTPLHNYSFQPTCRS